MWERGVSFKGVPQRGLLFLGGKRVLPTPFLKRHHTTREKKFFREKEILPLLKVIRDPLKERFNQKGLI